jgi:hypothetical protein
MFSLKRNPGFLFFTASRSSQTAASKNDIISAAHAASMSDHIRKVSLLDM